MLGKEETIPLLFSDITQLSRTVSTTEKQIGNKCLLNE